MCETLPPSLPPSLSLLSLSQGLPQLPDKEVTKLDRLRRGVRVKELVCLYIHSTCSCTVMVGAFVFCVETFSWCISPPTKLGREQF